MVTSDTVRYAAYGSNLHPLRLRERIASAQLLGTGFLPGWSLRFHKRSQDASGKAGIVPGGDGVHLAIFELSVADKLVLDDIEGVGAGYVAMTLSVPDLGECESYVAEEPFIDDALRPYDWYRELVLAGARFHGFPDCYVDSIASVPALADPDPGRSADGWKTVELVKSGS